MKIFGIYYENGVYLHEYKYRHDNVENPANLSGLHYI